jgi:hypothetical protein
MIRATNREVDHQSDALDVGEGLVALRARNLEPGVGFGEGGLDLSLRVKTLGLTKSAHPGELGQELPKSGAASPADDDCFFRERQGPCTITEPEMRRRQRCEPAAFDYGKPTFPSDRQPFPGLRQGTTVQGQARVP